MSDDIFGINDAKNMGSQYHVEFSGTRSDVNMQERIYLRPHIKYDVALTLNRYQIKGYIVYTIYNIVYIIYNIHCIYNIQYTTLYIEEISDKRIRWNTGGGASRHLP